MTTKLEQMSVEELLAARETYIDLWGGPPVTYVRLENAIELAHRYEQAQKDIEIWKENEASAVKLLANCQERTDKVKQQGFDEAKEKAAACIPQGGPLGGIIAKKIRALKMEE